MKIDRKLNLVFPIDTDAGTVYVHSTPISREVFEQFFLVIGKTFSALYAEGLNVMAGPRVAMMLLKKIAEETGVWDGPNGVERGLVAEVRRLTNVIVRSDDGNWSSIPYQEALARKMIDDEDASEAEGAVVFFICASAMHRREQLRPILIGMASLWGSQITSYSSTEFGVSLRTSTETDNSGETTETDAGTVLPDRPGAPVIRVN